MGRAKRVSTPVVGDSSLMWPPARFVRALRKSLRGVQVTVVVEQKSGTILRGELCPMRVGHRTGDSPQQIQRDTRVDALRGDIGLNGTQPFEIRSRTDSGGAKNAERDGAETQQSRLDSARL